MGEQYLPAWGVCNLAHLVLGQFYDPKTNDVKWDDLARATKLGVRFQDNMTSYTEYFLDANEKQQTGERRTGLGSTGIATLLIKMGIRYGSDECIEFLDKLYKFIAVKAYEASIDLAVEKGMFEFCVPEKMKQSGFMKRLYPELPKEYQDKFDKYGIRNVTLLTQAPVGSTGTLLDNIPEINNSTGIEPYFAFEYFRASRNGFAKQEVKLAKTWKEENKSDALPEWFVTAQDLSPEDHVRVQAAIQKWVDSSISKTANCPEDFTIENTKTLYELAYDLGCKGVTIYRANSRQAQVLSTDKDKAKLETDIEAENLNKLKQQEQQNVEAQVTPKINIPKRPKRLYGFTEKVAFTYGDRFGKAYVTINLHEGNPWEVFISTKEKDVSALAKALGLMTTKLLRLGGTSDNLQQAIDTLKYDQTMGTLPSALANILTQLQKEKLELEVSTGKREFKMAKCPSCGEEAYDKGNCICHACGVSKCN